MMREMLSREEFERAGLLRLPGAIPPAAVTTMRDAFWEFLAGKHGITRDRPDTWTVGTPRQLQPLKRSGRSTTSLPGSRCSRSWPRWRVRELTGQPGDVILMHPRTLHAPAPNALATPRMMLVEIINRRA
jgi:hypothetical protein